MNILFVSHNLYPSKIGGAEIFNYYLMRELSKSHKIFVLTCCKKGLDLDCVSIEVKPRRFGLRRVSIPLQDFMNIANLRKNIDLFHVSYMRSSCFQWLPYPMIKKIYGIPYVISIYGGGMHKWKPEFPHRLLFKNADAIVGVSEKIKEEYEKRSNRHIDLIPASLPFEQSRLEKSELRDKYGFEVSDTVLFSLGSLKKIKGSDILLDAFISLGEDFIKRHRLRLLFAGDGEMRPSLEARVIAGGLDKYVKFSGAILQEDISGIYKMSDIYIIPSLFEGKSISMLEAMFNAMPIIGSDTTGINDVIVDRENGLLFNLGDSDDLAKKIKTLVEDKELARDIGVGARKTFGEKFDFKAVLSAYTDIYKRICKK